MPLLHSVSEIMFILSLKHAPKWVSFVTGKTDLLGSDNVQLTTGSSWVPISYIYVSNPHSIYMLDG
jgi:hypothetical protein